mmetsp:Transcript_70470/g.213299  ORF Transcript_70470/g.213299 Transcript_70470/m.213299 type:complete len:248 (-) Transcript_70470:685-1428(-)
MGCEAPPSETYDCNAGFSNWQAGWSPGKKQWCCAAKGMGCEAPPPPAPPAAFALPALAGDGPPQAAVAQKGLRRSSGLRRQQWHAVAGGRQEWVPEVEWRPLRESAVSPIGRARRLRLQGRQRLRKLGWADAARPRHGRRVPPGQRLLHQWWLRQVPPLRRPEVPRRRADAAPWAPGCRECAEEVAATAWSMHAHLGRRAPTTAAAAAAVAEAGTATAAAAAAAAGAAAAVAARAHTGTRGCNRCRP